MEIYVGNLPWSTSDQDLADAFGAFGKVEKASIISDRNSGRSKGFRNLRGWDLPAWAFPACPSPIIVQTQLDLRDLGSLKP